MWGKSHHQGYMHAGGDLSTSSNDYIFDSDDSGVSDLQHRDAKARAKPSFFRSLSSLARSSHDYASGNGRTSFGSGDRPGQTDASIDASKVIGAGFSHLDRVLSSGSGLSSRNVSPERSHGKHKHKHHHKRDDGLGGDDDWNADIDDIFGQKKLDAAKAVKSESKDVQFYPSLAGLTIDDEKVEVTSPATPTTPPVTSPFPLVRSDYHDLLNNPFSILTTYEARDKEKSRYHKIVKALTQTPFDMAELKKHSWGGIPAAIRPLVWQVLVGYLPVNAGTRGQVLSRKRKEYVKGIRQLYASQKDEVVWHQIQIDVPRTNPGIKLYSFDATHRSLERILYLWAVRHPASGYVQGINDLVTPFYQVFLSAYLQDPATVIDFDPKDAPSELLNSVEADTYWCLTKILDTIQDNYIHEQPGIIRQIKELHDLISRDEPLLAQHFEHEGLDFIQFAFRWMNCLLMREFEMPLVVRMWDTYLSDFPNGFSRFHVYVCCAFLRHFSEQLQNMEFQDIIMFLQDSSKTKGWKEDDIEMILSEAYVWQSLYENALAHLK